MGVGTAAGETPSLTGEVVGETHRGLERTNFFNVKLATLKEKESSVTQRQTKNEWCMKKSVERRTRGSKTKTQNSLSKARSGSQLEGSKVTQG